MWWKYYVLIYENGKMRPVETLPRVGGEGIKGNDGEVNSTMIYYTNFYRYHNVSPAQQ
jgi:hypothetical protein